MHAGGTTIQHGQPLPADLPTVTEGAVKHRPAPARRNARQRRIPVIHAGSQYDPPRGHETAVGQLKYETVAAALAPKHVAAEHLHARVAGELFTTSSVEGGRRSTVMTEETADALGCQVALRTGIDDERPLTGSSQHERGTEPGSPATHHDAIPCRLHAIDGDEPMADLSTPLPEGRTRRRSPSTTARRSEQAGRAKPQLRPHIRYSDVFALGGAKRTARAVETARKRKQGA
jgi:hypothetical protein